MKVGLNVDKNLKVLFAEISSLEYWDISDDETTLEKVEVVVIDSKKERLYEYLNEYRKRGLLVIILIDENAVYEMRDFLLGGLVDNCIVRRDIFKIEERLRNLSIFYKLDRSTIINLSLIQILDFKDERIIFKNGKYIYTSKAKLKELEGSYFKERSKEFLVL